MKKNLNLGLLILRLSIAVLMLFHGFAKLPVSNIGWISDTLVGMGLPGFFAYAVYIGEFVAPLAIIVGFRTRIFAAIFVINCLVAMLLAHSNEFFSLSEIGGGWALETLGLYLFGAVTLFFTGAGKYSLSSNNTWD